MDLTVCVSDDDLEAWRAVRIAVESGDRCPSVAELRAMESSNTLRLLAVADGVVLGSGTADRAETADAAFVAPRVLPEHRRSGVGSTLLARLAEHCAAMGVPTVVAGVDDEGSFAFAQRFGFAEVDREVEQLRAIGDEPAPPALPDDVEVVLLSEQPELWAGCFEVFGRQVLADFALHSPLDISAEQWVTGGWVGDPMFLALHDAEVIGCAGVLVDADRPDRGENALTAVRRDWRGKGVAAHLKRRTLHWAAANGLKELYTWTQAGNTSMLRLNEHLGYVPGRSSATMSRSLPIEGVGP